MTIKSKINNFLSSILNKKNYNIIIILLLIFILLFLLLGNYNLVFKEGLSLQEEIENLNNNSDIAHKEASNKEKFKEKMISNEKNHVHNNGIIETMSNQKYNPNSNCDSDFSNLGLSGNTGNETFNTLCQSQNKLIQKNRSLINK